MNLAPDQEKQQAFLGEILSFVSRTSGVKSKSTGDARTRLTQSIDGKSLEFATTDLESVLLRSDTEGQEFIQVNFITGKKVLITNALIGFKPVALKGLDLAKLPRVVTTPDILSVFDAIQDALHASDADEEEIGVLKRVFEAVLAGGESIGFDLSKERSWITRIPAHLTRTAA